MIDFFERNSISPYEDTRENMVHLEKNIQKRINAVIAIVKISRRIKPNPPRLCCRHCWNRKNLKKILLVEKKRQSVNQPNYREHLR